MVFNPVSIDEPLLHLLKERIPETELINDINELPSLADSDSDSDNEGDEEKLLIVDDFINMNKKDFNDVVSFAWTPEEKNKFPFLHICRKEITDKKFRKSLINVIDLDSFKRN